MPNITSRHDLTWFEYAIVVAVRRRGRDLATAFGGNPNPAGSAAYAACQRFLEAYDPVYADARAGQARLAAAGGGPPDPGTSGTG